MRPAKAQISLGIRPVWSESSLCAKWVAKDPSFLHVDSEDWSDRADAQAWRTLILLVFSCRGSVILFELLSLRLCWSKMSISNQIFCSLLYTSIVDIIDKTKDVLLFHDVYYLQTFISECKPPKIHLVDSTASNLPVRCKWVVNSSTKIPRCWIRDV